MRGERRWGVLRKSPYIRRRPGVPKDISVQSERRERERGGERRARERRRSDVDCSVCV